MIRAEHLVKRYGAVPALDGVSFEVEPGCILGFLGPNGAGKSTTLRILSGWLPPTSGRASIAGHDLARDSLRARAAVGYLPEQFAAPTEMRVGEYLCYRAELKGRAPRAARVRAQEVAHSFGLDERWQQSFGALSKGYRQRVGLADALLADPPALLLDEPFSGLDPVQRQEFKTILRGLARAGKAVMFSSHVLPEVQDLVDRVLILHRGRAAAAGTLDELQRRLQRSAPLRVQADLPAAELDALAAAHGFRFLREERGGGRHYALEPNADRAGFFRALAGAPGAAPEFHTPAPDLEELFLMLVQGEAA